MAARYKGSESRVAGKTPSMMGPASSSGGRSVDGFSGSGAVAAEAAVAATIGVYGRESVAQGEGLG
jgi:16S rRNA G966 N2-methylase RsmD